MDNELLQKSRESMLYNTILYMLLYIVGAILILFSLLNDEIFLLFEYKPSEEDLFILLDILAFGFGVFCWVYSEFSVRKKIVHSYKMQWVQPIFKRNWNLTAYETDAKVLRVVSDFAICSDAFLEKVLSVELNDYAVGYFGGYKCYFMDVQPVDKENGQFNGQIFGIQMEKKKFDRRVTLRPSSIHNKHGFDSLPLMENPEFSSRFSFFEPVSGCEIGPSRKKASMVEEKYFVGEVKGWHKIQLMDKVEISAAGFFTPKIADFLLNSEFGYTGISLYKDMIFLFFSKTASQSSDVFEFHFSDIFKSDKVMFERLEGEFQNCMYCLMDLLDSIKIDEIITTAELRKMEEDKEKNKKLEESKIEEDNKENMSEMDLQAKLAQLEASNQKLLARNAELQAKLDNSNSLEAMGVVLDKPVGIADEKQVE